jgi:hypothetical protein
MRGSGLFPLLCRQPVLREMYIQNLQSMREPLARPGSPHWEGSPKGMREKRFLLFFFCSLCLVFLTPFPSFLPHHPLFIREMIEWVMNQQNCQRSHLHLDPVEKLLLQGG